jgi:hypothetical protein
LPPKLLVLQDREQPGIEEAPAAAPETHGSFCACSARAPSGKGMATGVLQNHL